MKVLIDGHIFAMQSSGGVSRYFVELARGLNAIENEMATVLAPAHINTHLNHQGKELAAGCYFPARKGVGRACQLVTKTLSPLLSSFRPHDIVHETYYSLKPYFASSAPRIITVHDMIHEIYGLDSATTLKKKATLDRCAHVICISDNTRNDLCNIFGIDPIRTSTVHHGYKDFSSLAGSPADAMFGEKPFFLYVGQRNGYKNFDRFLRAFAAQSKLAKDTCVVCIGGGRLTPHELQTIREVGLSRQSVLQLEGSDETLAAAYSGAIALVYPSLYEGFGFPPLEAMSVGCPVVCSNASCIPEIVGSAALMFDPLCEDAIGDALVQIASSATLRCKFTQLGHEQRAKFSWERCCRETLDIYRMLASHGRVE